MKTKLFTLLYVVLLSSNIFAESGVSLRTRMLMNEGKDIARNAPTRNDSIAEEQRAELFLFVSDDFDSSCLNSMNVRIDSDFGDILTVSAPIGKIAELTQTKGVEYVRVELPVKTNLDVAVPLIDADMVWNGVSLPHPYTGKGIVVGVVDLGLDFTHPAFRANDGKLRISRAWIQTDTKGSRPSGFSYGAEIVGEKALLARQYSSDKGSHGTHVCGIAASNDNIYKGVAPEAEIVFVEIGGTDANVVDGVNYIFKYAASVGKPAVVNLSLGSQAGSRDGKSFIDNALNKLVTASAGRVIVGAAGNEGHINQHISHTFASATDTLRSIIDINDSENEKLEGYINIWGNENASFEIAIEVYDLATRQVLYTTGFGKTANNYYTNKNWQINGQNIEVLLNSTSRYSTNRKPCAEIYVKNPLHITHGVALVLKSTTGVKIDVWNGGIGNGAELSALKLARNTGWTNGDTNSTISEIGGTGENIISVGSYNSRVNPISHISLFSSKGPTSDGRTKPDIAAPGSYLISSINTFDPASEHKLYGAMQGTSMAAPMMTGAVALMLQKNPELTPSEVKTLLKETAEQDAFTGNIDENGNNIWGFGKLNVWNIITSSNIEPKPKIEDLLVLYNSATREIILKTKTESTNALPVDRIEIFDIVGRKAADVKNADKMNVSALASGLFILKIHSGRKAVVRKVLVF